MKAQRAGPEARVLGLPVLAQAADRRGRQPGRVLAEQLLERRAEVPGRQATQVEHRQHIVDLRRAPRVGRQDPRREPLALPALAVNALVVDPGAWIATVPDPTVTLRSLARPLRTTSRPPSSPRSSANRSTYSPTSASSAVAIILRAPSRASTSSETATSSSCPTGSLRTSSMACLPAGHHRHRS